MNRRNFIRTTGISLASFLVRDSLRASAFLHTANLIDLPHAVMAIVDGKSVTLVRDGNHVWRYHDVLVTDHETAGGISVSVQAPNVRLSEVSLHWNLPSNARATILNDHWERTYGDVSWHIPKSSEILPWYFLEFNKRSTSGFGVKTGTHSFCSWRAGDDGLHLTLDTRNGGDGVALGDRTLHAAEIITTTSFPAETPFQTTRRFLSLMCDRPRMPTTPVYGINDWYFTYGRNSEKLILEHTALMAPLAEGLTNRPFSVIDAGWFKFSPLSPDDVGWGEDMGISNDNFGDMSRMAEEIKTLGMRPGIWTRPLCGNSTEAPSAILPMIEGREVNKPVLDPSIPDHLERIKRNIRLYKQWGYELIKFDYTSFDIFGRWGFEMLKSGSMSQPNWHMSNSSKTNAEIVLDLYNAIREAAGGTTIISCNTFSHLAAGLFELNRIGDDTSGNEWARTRTMGVNTLAFRGVHHGIFYAADPDCVGLTEKIAWDRNKQWMELVAKSGTPLFISAQPQATGEKQKAAIRESFTLASQALPLGEPLDWMEKALPEKWNLNGSAATFSWA